MELEGTQVHAGTVVVCADAWTNQVLAPLGVRVPLSVTLEQVTYFAPPDPEPFRPGRLPLWIWMDDPSFYAFPCYGDDTVKAAQDCGGPLVDPEHRTHDRDPAMQRLLADHVTRVAPGVGPPVRSLRCQYTLTPDRDFVLSPLPGHPGVWSGWARRTASSSLPPSDGSWPTWRSRGRPTSDVAPFGLDRPALTDPSYATHWLV